MNLLPYCYQSPIYSRNNFIHVNLQWTITHYSSTMSQFQHLCRISFSSSINFGIILILSITCFSENEAVILITGNSRRIHLWSILYKRVKMHIALLCAKGCTKEKESNILSFVVKCGLYKEGPTTFVKPHRSHDTLDWEEEREGNILQWRRASESNRKVQNATEDPKVASQESRHSEDILARRVSKVFQRRD